jgi:hypothetical protein
MARVAHRIAECDSGCSARVLHLKRSAWIENAVKDSKKGLSRTALVMAATGKEGGTAKIEAKRFADAGEVLAHLIEEQSYNDVTLLDTDNNRRLHLCEIKQAPQANWPLLFDLLVEHSWSVKDTKAAVDRIKAVDSGCSARVVRR